jgi:hypothetical protein
MKEELTRCGACGDFQQDPRQYTQEEQDNAKLVHCGCENMNQIYQPTTEELVSAGIISLDSQGNPL